ncbi:iron chelate uptake ABC transporter family permease subunit [Streptomyces sp. NRRL B-1677]|uniref:Iron ABC transporter permease n=1 Tax=Streptomyces klenkii TaxID=1420899 RepID=A0A3B0AXC1_9ACTN|nr:iron chelate uptake ABC transporter family permease subunit [Streptomyces sp. NRRL B-1677]RKN65102.1 iron ABC transporter permease [Streptomyces klenkii]
MGAPAAVAAERAEEREPGARAPWVAAALGCALLVALTASVCLGSSDVPLGDVWSSVVRGVSGQAPVPGTQDLIVWRLRVPRALLAAVVGAGLGLVGTAVQALVRNPLADPYLLGISSGASLGAVGAIVLGAGAGGLLGLGLSAAAFAGALASFALVWAMARRGGGFSPLRLVLAGVGIGQFLSGFTHYLVLQAGDDQQTHGVLFWLMGSLGGAQWSTLGVPAAAVVLGLAALLARARALDAVLMGDETAAGLGVDVTRLRRELFVVTSVLTGVLVSVSGAIGFVGLMVPHVCRMVVGGAHRVLLPVAALFGAVLLVVVDLVARTALPDQELPVGVVTALVGAPTLLYLLDRRLVERG